MRNTLNVLTQHVEKSMDMHWCPGGGAFNTEYMTSIWVN